MNLFSFYWSERFANKTLALHRLHPPTDFYKNNVTERVKGVVDAVSMGGEVAGEHEDVRP